MKKQRKRLYSSEHLTAINHPLRISLLKLIKKKINTAPDLADALGENRINLYHHLKFLEKTGLITSKFKGDRVKRYEIVDKPANIQQNIVTNPIISSNTIIISPNPKNQDNFRKKVDELVELDGISIKKDMDIIQVQIVVQSQRTTELIESIVKEKRNKNSN